MRIITAWFKFIQGNFPLFLLFEMKGDQHRREEYTLSPRVEDQRPHIIINEFG